MYDDTEIAPTPATLLRYTDKFRSADPVVWLNASRQVVNQEPTNVWSAYLFDKQTLQWNLVDEVDAEVETPDGAMISSSAK